MDFASSFTLPADMPCEAELLQLLTNAFKHHSTLHRTKPAQWLCFRLQIKLDDPWLFLPSTAITNESFAAINDEHGCLLAMGETTSKSFNGKNCWELAEKYYQTILQNIVITKTNNQNSINYNETPLILAGFGYNNYHDAHAITHLWQQWPDARIVLPKISIWQPIVDKQDMPNCFCVLSICLSLADFIALPTPPTAKQLAKLANQLQHLINSLLQRYDHLINKQLKYKKDKLDNNHCNSAKLKLEPLEDERDFQKRVANARAALQNKNIDKIVLARAVSLHTPSEARFDVPATLLRLRAEYSHLTTIFAFSLNGDEVFIGATPERLFTLTGKLIETHAIAGTIKRGEAIDEDNSLGEKLLTSNKNRIEHETVVTHLRMILTPLCETLYIDSSPQLCLLPQMQHLETKVTGKLRDLINPIKLASQLHPTPAVCGWPIAEANRWLCENETLARGWYAGSLGYLYLNGNATFTVAIRSALVKKNVAYIFAGAGIVAQSDAQAEWQETELKLATMRDSLMIVHQQNDNLATS
ncbi:MAG: isochorismate synthase [Deltaproteobacteria bacterium]|nr:isochorismate synthase [Deltaproteobacteria bacterium]